MFVWDESKREQVIKEHKVDFAEIGDVFDDAYAIDFVDEAHSTEDETRYDIIGKTARYGLVFLVYATESETDTKFITARRAEPWMVRDYEKNRHRF